MKRYLVPLLVVLFCSSARADEESAPGIWYIGEFDDANLAEGINVLSWTSCCDSETPSPDWPGKNTTNSMSFSPDVCESRPASPSELTILGNFYVTAYSSSLMQTIPVPLNGNYSMTGCEGEPTQMPWSRAAGWIAFGNRSEGQGVNPCYFTPVKTSTWGALKKSSR